MHTFAEKPKAAQQAASPKTTVTGRPPLERGHGVNSILHLQRTIGNQAVQRLLRGNAGAIQTKLAINRPGDAYEQEADRVAEQVMRMPEAGASPPASHSMQGQESAAPASPDAPQIVSDVVSETGRPLEPPVRSFMEPRFGQDFSHVQIHTGSRAAESARAVNATAYTVGRHVVFGEGAYRPETDAGRRLIAHELTHVGQQGAAGASLQRNPDEEAAGNPPMDLEAMFEALEKENKKPIGPKRRERLREWVAEYEKKTGRKVDLDIMRGVLTRWLMHGSLPEIKTAAEVEAEKHKPPVPCNEIIPYKVGEKLLVTHLLDKILPADRIDILKKIASEKEKENEARKAEEGKKTEEKKESSLEDIIRAHPSAVFDLIMSKDVPKSATAVITESGPEMVKATVAVPGIPAKGDLPAYEAFTATMSLEFDTFMKRGYELKFTRETAGGQSTAFSMQGLQISRSDEGIQVGVGKDEYFKVRIVKGKDGNLNLQVFEIHALAKSLLGIDDPLTLVNVAPTGEQPAEVKKTEEGVRSKYQAPPKMDRPEIVGGTGFQWTDRPEALLSLGWRFTFSPGLGILQVPLMFQVDYAPRADVFGGIYTGTEFTIPGKTPVTLSVIGGARAGSMETQGPKGEPDGRIPVGGPVWGIGAGIQLAPPVELQIDTSLMLNVLQLGTGQGPLVIPAVGIKTSIEL